MRGPLVGAASDPVCTAARTLLMITIVVVPILAATGAPAVWVAVTGAVGVGVGAFIHTFCSDHAPPPGG